MPRIALGSIAVVLLACTSTSLGGVRPSSADAAGADAAPPTDAGTPSPVDAFAERADAFALGDAFVAPADAFVAPDAAHPHVSDAGAPSTGCEVIADHPGLVFVSTSATPRYYESFPATGARSYHRFEADVTVTLPHWSAKQGQYEIFSLLRGRRWTGYAIGYASFVGPGSRAVVTTANLGLDGAAAPPGGDGRRASASLAIETMRPYHLHYVYDTTVGRRTLEVRDDGGALLRTLGGATFVPTVDVEPEGAGLVMGGTEIDGAPDASTLDWSFSDVTIRACP